MSAERVLSWASVVNGALPGAGDRVRIAGLQRIDCNGVFAFVFAVSMHVLHAPVVLTLGRALLPWKVMAVVFGRRESDAAMESGQVRPYLETAC